MAKKDSLYGFVSDSFPIYEDGFDQSGVIYVCEGGLVIKEGERLIRSPLNYVRHIEKVAELPLGKVSMIFKTFDQMGQEHQMAVAINDIHYEKLKRMCPKAGAAGAKL